MSHMGLCRLKSRCWEGLSPGNSRGESLPLPFQLLETAYIPVASHHSKLIVKSPSPPPTLLRPSHGDPCGSLGWAHQDDPG